MTPFHLPSIRSRVASTAQPGLRVKSRRFIQSFPIVSKQGLYPRIYRNYILDKYSALLYRRRQRVTDVSILSQPHFHNEAAAYARLEAIVWPDGPFCPKCAGFHRITPVKGGRVGLRRCGPCKREFTVKVGTVFEDSKIKLHLWFQAAHLMASSKKGISAHQLHRTLKVTYKTAWFMEHRLREAMREGHLAMGGEGKTVEIDETFVGGLEKNKHRGKRKHAGTGGAGKEAVFSLVERGGKVRSHRVPQVMAKTLRPILQAQVHSKTAAMTEVASG
jgi:transposase-like protein